MSEWRISDQHPLCEYVGARLGSFLQETEGWVDSAILAYLTQLATEFAHSDADAITVRGERISDLIRLFDAGEVLLSAASFEEERRVHKHIGDLMLFWSGVFPEQLDARFPASLLDPAVVGSTSYHVVSTFDYPPHDQEAPKYKKLSDRFDLYVLALRSLRPGDSTFGEMVN